MGRALTPTVQSRAVDDPTVATAWQDLQERDGVRTPFLSWEWASGFVAVPEIARRVRVLIVIRDGRPVGLFPVERVAGPGRLTTLGPAGWTWLTPDHLDVVAQPADRDQVAAAVVDHLTADRDWDVLDLDGLRADGALARASARLRPPWFLRRPDEAVRAPYVALREVGGEGERPLLRSKNLRKQVGRGLRVAQARGGGLTVVAQPEQVVAALDVLMRLHMDRFGTASAVFATEARRRFHRAVAARLAARGLAVVHRLSTAEGDAGLLYVLRLGDTAHAYAGGMAPDSTLSPGRTVYGQAVLAAAADGLAELDLLRGEHDYKMRFATSVRVDVRRRVVRLGPRVGLAAAGRLPGRISDLVRAAQQG